MANEVLPVKTIAIFQDGRIVTGVPLVFIDTTERPDVLALLEDTVSVDMTRVLWEWNVTQYEGITALVLWLSVPGIEWFGIRFVLRTPAVAQSLFLVALGPFLRLANEESPQEYLEMVSPFDEWVRQFIAMVPEGDVKPLVVRDVETGQEYDIEEIRRRYRERQMVNTA
jgi:hypothetical protein